MEGVFLWRRGQKFRQARTDSLSIQEGVLFFDRIDFESSSHGLKHLCLVGIGGMIQCLGWIRLQIHQPRTLTTGNHQLVAFRRRTEPIPS